MSSGGTPEGMDLLHALENATELLSEPPALSHAEREALTSRPHCCELAHLTDEERSALMGHLARLDAAIERHRAGVARLEDYPFDLDTVALELGLEIDLDLDGAEDDLDYARLSDYAAALLLENRSTWIRAAEAHSRATADAEPFRPAYY